MKTKNLWRCAALVLALTTTACGGGGAASTANPAAASTAIASLKAPAGFSFATSRPRIVVSQQALLAVGGFSATQPSRTYVSLWYFDASQQRQSVAFMSLSALQSLDAAGGLKLQMPLNSSPLQVEIYDDTAAKTGSLGA